jgi:hypothetical protein
LKDAGNIGTKFENGCMKFLFIVQDLRVLVNLVAAESIVTNLLGSISRWKFITLRVQYTTLDYSSQLF